MLSRILFYMILVLIAGCSHSQVDDKDYDELSSYYGEVAESQEYCANLTLKIINEWIENGGGLKSSLLETRKQIELDDRSLLAKIIRNGWKIQKQRGFFEDIDDFGYWPLDDKKTREVIMPEAVYVNGTKIAEECVLIYFRSVMWNEFMSNGRYLKPIEAPKDIKWGMYNAQRWLNYWLFANVEKES